MQNIMPSYELSCAETIYFNWSIGFYRALDSFQFNLGVPLVNVFKLKQFEAYRKISTFRKG